MIFAALIALVLGILCGSFFFSPSAIHFFSECSNYILCILMLSVGISVGSNKLVMKKLQQHNLKILVIPVGIVFGSLLGGVLSALLLGQPLRMSTAVAAGMGWYSLSGVMLNELLGPNAGTIAFLSNLMREILAFMMIPLLIKYTNVYTAIAPAGATSEDTTLPVLIKYAGEDTVVISVINGMLCSALVPILINFICKFPS